MKFGLVAIVAIMCLAASCTDRALAGPSIAHFGDRCSRDAELIGHPLPGYVDAAHDIVNEYPLALELPSNKLRALQGYIYITRSHEAFLASVHGQLRIGRDTDVGENYLAPSALKLVAEWVGFAVTEPATFWKTEHLGKCFERDWDGTYPHRS